MSLLADALRPSLISGITSICGRPVSMGLPSIILARNSAFTLGFDTIKKSVLLDFREDGAIAAAFAADCCKLSASSIQTVASIKIGDKNKHQLPWNLIKLYYASFYSAHLIIRLLGRACYWLDHKISDRIDRLAEAADIQDRFKLDTASYLCLADENARSISFKKIDINGGAHEALWVAFHDTLTEVSNAIINGPMQRTESQAAFAKIESYLSLSKKHKSKSWLSRFRNDLQYKLLYDVWHPASISKKEREQLERAISKWRNDPMQISPDAMGSYTPLNEFVSSCVFIISLGRILMLKVNDSRPSKGVSFFKFGPLSFADDAQIDISTRI